MAALELIVLTTAFWMSSGSAYRQKYFEDQSAQSQRGTGLWDALFKMPASRVSWTSALFLLAYVGVEVALGGWVATFMSQVRNQDNFNSGMSAAGFWLGVTVGRVVLGFVTPRVGIKVAMAVSGTRVSHRRNRLTSIIGVYWLCYRLGTCILACASVYRFGCSRVAARILPRAHVPRSDSRR